MRQNGRDATGSVAMLSRSYDKEAGKFNELRETGTRLLLSTERERDGTSSPTRGLRTHAAMTETGAGESKLWREGAREVGGEGKGWRLTRSEGRGGDGK